MHITDVWVDVHNLVETLGVCHKCSQRLKNSAPIAMDSQVSTEAEHSGENADHTILVELAK